MKGIIVFCFGALAVLYLMNPTLGMFELIPDNFPVIGNLDEAAATSLLIVCLRYFGIDLFSIFDPSKDTRTDIKR